MKNSTDFCKKYFAKKILPETLQRQRKSHQSKEQYNIMVILQLIEGEKNEFTRINKMAHRSDRRIGKSKRRHETNQSI